MKGPVSATDITEALCYSSKVTGLVINKLNLSEVSEKILDLKITINRNYQPVKLDGKFIRINPAVNLAYAPSSGFDTIIYYIKLDEHRTRFPIGYSKLSQVVGNSTLNEVESIHYNTITISLENLEIMNEFLPVLSDIGDTNMDISDPQKNYLESFKKYKDLKTTIHVESPINPTNNVIFRTLPFNNIENQLIPGGESSYWTEGEKAPIWIGSDGIRIWVAEDKFMFLSLRQSSGLIYTTIDKLKSLGTGSIVDENWDPDDNFRFKKLPRFITREFIIDENGALWSYPRLSKINYNNEEGKTLRIMGYNEEKEELTIDSSTTTFPLSLLDLYDQPLLDIFSGTLVSERSMFSNVIDAQHRVRDIVNTIIPLTLLFSDNGKIWIKCKIGAWFVFDLPQYNAEVIQNRTTAVVVPRNKCQFYPINDKSILVRTPRGLNLFNTPGEWCDSYTMDNLVTRFPHSKLLGRFSVGGEMVDEGNIFSGPLNRYRKGVLPKGNINIVGAIEGIIIYYQLQKNNKIYISYL